MNRWFRSIVYFVLTVALQACSSVGSLQSSAAPPIPGGVFDWGSAQRAENFANVEIAQSRLNIYEAYPGPWIAIRATNFAFASVMGLRTYYPMQARWKLKDGREFILENIDQNALVRAYLEAHSIKMPWEREGRAFTVGDSFIALTHEIKDDTLRLKWIVTINLTPVSKRLRADKAANPWQLEEEEHVIAVIKGVQTHGIDFLKINEPRK